MIYTLDQLLKTPTIIGAIVDRAEALNANKVIWKDLLKFEQTKTRKFSATFGEKGEVRMGSFLDKNANKPLRGRKGLGTADLEVLPLGDRMQMDNDRLDLLIDIVNRINASGTTGQHIAEFANIVATDMEELALAPHKRMDKVLGDLLSKGSADVELAGGKLGTMDLPILKETLDSNDNLLQALMSLTSDKFTHLEFGKMLMNQKTFNKFFALNPNFIKSVKHQAGSDTVDYSGIITENLANSLLSSLGLPQVQIIKGSVKDLGGNRSAVFEDNKITLLPNGEIGAMRWHTPFEMTDKVPNKTYVEREGGMFISTQRTDEGRFIEYGAEWVPEIRAVKSILNLDLTRLNG